MNTRTAPIVSLVKSETPLPHSIEAEQALLGLIMLNNDVFDDVDEAVMPEHFYVPFHEVVFETMRSLLRRGYEASPLTLRDSLRKREEYEEGEDLIEHLIDLAENASLSSDVKALAHIISNHHRQRRLIAVAQEILHKSSLQVTPEDTDELLFEAEANLYQIGEERGIKEFDEWGNALQEVVSQIYGHHDDDKGIIGVTTGLASLDEMTGGFVNSDLIILAGRPAMGKTALALNMAFHAAQAKKLGKTGGAGVGIFSMEMATSQLMLRFVSGASKIDGNRMWRGGLKAAELDKLQRVSQGLTQLPIVIDDSAALDIDVIRSKARRMVRKHRVGMIVVDYLQLMQCQRVARNGRVQEISAISQGLKAMAKELDIPVLALSQLSRANETRRDSKRPQLSDLRDSGSIEQDADMVMFIHREDYYLARQFGLKETWAVEQQALMRKHEGAAELIIGKYRKGATGSIGLRFDAASTRFYGLEKNA